MKQQTAADLLQPLIKKIAAYKKDKQLTSNQIAKKAGVSWPTFSRLEKNKTSNISLRVIIAISKAIECNISEIKIK